MATKRSRRKAKLSITHPHAAGIDIGSRFHVVAVPADHDPEPVRSFDTFTGDLYRLADWLSSTGITTIAMESTGLYWLPVFEILEERGFEVILANARDAKTVPGRKSDINDAQWLQQLHSYGLLRASFRPAQHVATLRAYMRHRDRLTQYAAAHVQHIQKALMQMNLQLHHVVSDVVGTTGQRILRAIIAGERDPVKLAQNRDGRCRTSEAKIAAALEGHYREEHLFAVTQALSLYDTYQAHIVDCDQCIDALLQRLQAPEHEIAPLATPSPGDRNRNRLHFDARTALYSVIGVDLTRIDGIAGHAALRLVSECGTDMSRWPSAKHFTSWLSLCPGTKISGGKVLSSRTRLSTNRAATVFRMTAVAVGRTQTALGAFYRRLAARIGKPKAVTATARKLATLFYNTLRYGWAYVDPGVAYYEARYHERVLGQLNRRAQAMGYRLEPTC